MREYELKQKFIEFVNQHQFKIIYEIVNKPADLIIEKDGKRIAVEFKTARDPAKFSRALGQLLFARIKYDVEDSWLILSGLPSILSKDWLEVFEESKITVFYFTGSSFDKITTEMLKFPERTYKMEGTHPSKRRSIETDKKIVEFLEHNKEGITFYDLSRIMNLSTDTIRNHVKRGLPGVSKEQIIIEEDKIKLL